MIRSVIEELRRENESLHEQVDNRIESEDQNVMVRIHSGNVLGDNIWLWRADHVKTGEPKSPNFPDMTLEYHQTVLGEEPVKTGLEVNGDYVVTHGFAF